MRVRQTSVAFLLWLASLIGLCGLHRFYVGRPLTGFLWLITFGLLGLGQFVDLFRLVAMTRKANEVRAAAGRSDERDRVVGRQSSFDDEPPVPLPPLVVPEPRRLILRDPPAAPRMKPLSPTS
jgi:TM2 domain-containing membrane protein YozV